MLAARLKNIFSTLLATQVASAAAMFVLWCYYILTYTNAKDTPPLVSLFFLVGVFFVTTIVFLLTFYKKMIRFHSSKRSVTLKYLATAEFSLLIIGVISLFVSLRYGTPQTPRIVVGYIASTMALTLILHLISSILIYKLYNHPRNKLMVLVVGMNARTEEFCRVINDTSLLGAAIHGYIDVQEVEGAPVRYLGTIDDLGVILRGQVIDMTSIFLPIRSFYDTIDIIIETCSFYGVTSYIAGNVFEADTIRRVPTSINDFGNMAYASTNMDYVGLGIKRMFDCLASLTALIALSPVLLAVAVYIKIVSRGPVFFRQERIGLNKRTFNMVKFRTMVPNAEELQEKLAAMNEMDGAAFKITNDPRLIKGGSFLRRHSIDELPQLLNVFKGDMTFVGPRPLSKRDFERMKDDWQRKRFSMRPGLTCTWQVTPSRNDVSFMDWMKMDLEYIDQWKLGKDFVLIAKTLKTVFRGTGK